MNPLRCCYRIVGLVPLLALSAGCSALALRVAVSSPAFGAVSVDTQGIGFHRGVTNAPLDLVRVAGGKPDAILAIPGLTTNSLPVAGGGQR